MTRLLLFLALPAVVAAQVTTCDPGCGTNPDADMSPLDNPRGFTEGSQNHTR